MTIALIIFLFPIFYLIAFFVIGGKYSSNQQEINKINRLMRTGKFNRERLLAKSSRLEFKIKRIKRTAWIYFLMILTVHVTINWCTFNDLSLYYYALISCAVAYVLLLGVYWLKGHGTIADNPRFPGGIE